MKKWNSFFSVLFAAVLLAATALVFNGCASTKTLENSRSIETIVSSIDKYGNSALAITEVDFWSTGLNAGDIVKIKLANAAYDIPVCTNYSDVDNGKNLLRVNGNVALSINMGNFAKENNLKVGDTVSIRLYKKEGYIKEYKTRQLKKSNLRSDFTSDEEFANFRAVKAGKIAENRLYRSCNPLAGDERAPYAEKLIAKANIQTVINLADTPEYAVSHYKSSPYYESLTKNGNVIFLNMGIAFTDEEFTKKLHDGLVFMSEHKVGPYLVHCNEGKDRAGFVNAILAAINEATMKEMIEDYMLSFENYFGVKKDSEQYKLIAQTVPDMFKAINGGRKVDNQTVQWVAERYLLKKVKLTRKQLKELKKVLQ